MIIMLFCCSLSNKSNLFKQIKQKQYAKTVRIFDKQVPWITVNRHIPCNFYLISHLGCTDKWYPISGTQVYAPLYEL
jgi:hypothetical protein